MISQQVATRAEVQAARVRMAAVGAGFLNATDLHRAIQEVLPIHYEIIRRIWAGERRREMERNLTKVIAQVTGFSFEWVVGDPDVELPANLNRDNPRYVNSSPLVAVNHQMSLLAHSPTQLAL